MSRSKHELKLYFENEIVKETFCTYDDASDPDQELQKIADRFQTDTMKKLLNLPEWDVLELIHDGVSHTFSK